MKNVVPLDRVAAEIHSPEFRRNLDRYVAHAAYLLRDKGMGESVHHAPCAAQAEDVVDETVADCLSGERKWAEGIPFATFFRDAIKSHVYHGCRDARKRRAEPMDGAAEVAAPSSRRVEVMDARVELAKAREVLSGDPRTKAMLDAIEDGAEKRGQVAEALGWDPEYVSIVRILARTRLAAARVRKNKRTG